MTTLPPARDAAQIKSGLSLHALTIVAFFAASSITTPLFPLYQSSWGVSAFMISVIVAVYVVSLLASLLFLGTLSNRFGRRPIILAALVIQVVAMGLYLLAQSQSGLIAARLVQGLATGIATTSVTTALLDLDHKAGAVINSLAPMLGMATGALGAGMLVQLAPAPLRLVYGLMLMVFVVQILRTFRSPETYLGRSPGGWSARPRIVVPVAARGAFLRILPINAAVWGLGAFFMSLLPSLLREISHSSSTAWLSGCAVAVLTLSGALAVVAFRNRPAKTALIVGGLAVILGALLILQGAWLASPTVLLLGALPAGMGFGAGFLGVLNSIVTRVSAQDRAGLLAAFYIASYLPNAMLAMLAGYAAQHIGVLDTALAFGALIIVLAIVSLLMVERARPDMHICPDL